MEFPAYKSLPEPKLTFEALQNAQDIHPLKGLNHYSAFSSKLNPISKIRVAAIYPAGTYHILKSLVNELHGTHQPRERKNYLEEFRGIQNIFKADVQLLPEDHSIALNGEQIFQGNAEPYIALSETISKAIREIEILPFHWAAIG